GATVLSGGTVEKTGVPLDLQGGALAGEGTVIGNVVNGANVAPGVSPGIIAVDGDYTQTASGVLTIELAGSLVPGTEFDQLQVTGSANLDGTLRVELISAFEPMAGQSFEILTCGSRNGTFATVAGPCGGVEGVFDVVYGTTSVTLLVTDDPVLGDMNLDGGVDLADVAMFQNCFSGSVGPVASCCERGDFNVDDTIDITDYVTFSGLIAGP
ncbi:MAG: hypothetical protein ACE5HE_05130, partial [Phycisphaerae bacterium]